MRVLFWSEVFWPSIGGAEAFGVNLIRGLRRRGYEFMVVTRQDDPTAPKESRFEGVPLYRLPFYKALSEGNVDKIIIIRQHVAALKRDFAPDLVHVNCFGPSVLFHLESFSAHPGPWLITLHGDRYPPPQGRNSLLEQTLRAAHWITGPSEATIVYARQLLPELSLPSSVIYNGLEMASVAPTPLPIDEPRLLCLGRLSPEKGFDLALKAFASVIDRFPRARLMIAGDGPERVALERQAARLGLGAVVDFVGWVAPEQVPALINTAMLVVMPSLREGLPLVAIEAALMARPVIATRVGGLAEVVLHEKTGLLIGRENGVEGLYEAITSLLEHPEAAAGMGEVARRHAQKNFGLERCVDGYDALYRQLIKETPYVGSA